MAKLLMTCGLVVALTACATSQTAPSASSSASGGSAVPAATTSAAPAAQSGAVAVAGKPKLVCEETDQMGSHFQQRVCMTPEQAEARRKAAQAQMQTYQTSGVTACGANGCAGGVMGSGPPR